MEIDPGEHNEKFFNNGKEHFYKRVLGKGAQGIVYLYEDKEGENKVAAKCAIKSNF